MTAETTQDYADAAIAGGSQSFAAASQLFDERTRRDVTKLYAWCRYCDDLVDGQVLGHGSVASPRSQHERLGELEAQTLQALDDGAIRHPAFAGLRDIAKTHQLPRALPLAHLEGFRADVEHRSYATLPDLLHYCYGVAGVVGIMMAHIMGVRDPRVLDRACDLGLAFQLTNIARDIVDDARNGRIYLPLEWLADAGIGPPEIAAPHSRAALAQVAKRLVNAAEPYYASARIGLGALPWRAAWAIATALGVYRAIGGKVVQQGASAWDHRVSTSKAEKAAFAAQGIWEATRSRSTKTRSRPADLWQRPQT